jgi:hypothetical protein
MSEWDPHYRCAVCGKEADDHAQTIDQGGAVTAGSWHTPDDFVICAETQKGRDRHAQAIISELEEKMLPIARRTYLLESLLEKVRRNPGGLMYDGALLERIDRVLSETDELLVECAGCLKTIPLPRGGILCGECERY